MTKNRDIADIGAADVPRTYEIKLKFLTAASGTYTPTAGVSWYEVWCCGGGGGGGGADGDGAARGGGGGGGGAGTAYRTYSVAEMGASAAYVMGDGGGGGSGTNGADGADGEDSTFNPAGTGPTLTGSGGLAGGGTGVMTLGTNQAGIPGAGGTASGGIVHRGGASAPGLGTDSPSCIQAGWGGGSYFTGAGGSGRASNGVGDACSSAADISTEGAWGFGGGGGGAGNIDTTAGSAGGDGGPGLILVKEHIIT